MILYYFFKHKMFLVHENKTSLNKIWFVSKLSFFVAMNESRSFQISYNMINQIKTLQILFRSYDPSQKFWNTSNESLKQKFIKPNTNNVKQTHQMPRHHRATSDRTKSIEFHSKFRRARSLTFQIRYKRQSII